MTIYYYESKPKTKISFVVAAVVIENYNDYEKEQAPIIVVDIT